MSLRRLMPTRLAGSGRVTTDMLEAARIVILLALLLALACGRFPNPCRTHGSDWRRGSESNRRMRLLQSPALPLGYPATRKGEANFVLRPKQVQVLPRTASTGKTQPVSLRPKFLRLENPRRRDDAGDQFRRRHVKARIARAAARIGHANVSALARLGIADWGLRI